MPTCKFLVNYVICSFKRSADAKWGLLYEEQAQGGISSKTFTFTDGIISIFLSPLRVSVDNPTSSSNYWQGGSIRSIWLWHHWLTRFLLSLTPSVSFSCCEISQFFFHCPVHSFLFNSVSCPSQLWCLFLSPPAPHPGFNAPSNHSVTGAVCRWVNLLTTFNTAAVLSCHCLALWLLHHGGRTVTFWAF